MKNILKCYFGEFSVKPKLPIPFLLNGKDNFENRLGDITSIDEQGYALIQLNNKGIAHFNQKKDDDTLYLVPPIAALPEIKEYEL